MALGAIQELSLLILMAAEHGKILVQGYRQTLMAKMGDCQH
jgi:hypothetical protein